MNTKTKTVLNVSILILAWSIFSFVVCYCAIHGKNRDQQIYELGYLNACEDMRDGKLQYNVIEDENKLVLLVKIDNLNAWDDKNYFDLPLAECPKCGSMRIIGNVPRDRGVVTAYICLDCGYTWKRK